jgi:fluoroquinolone resistance protein
MTERRRGGGAPQTDSTVAGEDWYGHDISGQVHTRVLFDDLDLTEVVNTGAVFTECSFRRTRFNASVHTDAAFTNCTFSACKLFDTSFVECKLLGSTFDRCSFDLMKVVGGN